MYRYVPVVALLAFVVFSGCGDLPNIPTIDQIRTVPDSNQVTLISLDQVLPKEGPIGTILTVNGRGMMFPAGIVRFTFSGNGAVEFDLPEESAAIKVQLPAGSISGPFGFTISGRDPLHLENSLPSTNLFKAYRIDVPGFRVTESTGIPDTTTSPPPNQSSSPNG